MVHGLEFDDVLDGGSGLLGSEVAVGEDARRAEGGEQVGEQGEQGERDGQGEGRGRGQQVQLVRELAEQQEARGEQDKRQLARGTDVKLHLNSL